VGPFTPVALSEEHDRTAFDCGEPSLTRYLTNESLAAHDSGETRTHVWLDEGCVVGYFTVALTQVTPGDMPRALRIGRGKSIPGYLLAKLALDSSLRGKHLGPDLLLDALSTIVRAADAVGGRVIVVDSLENNKVHAFYTAAEFTPLEGSYRLWMKVSTARGALGA